MFKKGLIWAEKIVINVVIHSLFHTNSTKLYVSGSSKIQILMIFIDHVPNKVGTANTCWVIYTLVSDIPTHEENRL